MLIRDALRAGHITPDAIRDFIVGTREWVGINGVYDFTKVPQRGLDETNAVVTRWQPE